MAGHVSGVLPLPTSPKLRDYFPLSVAREQLDMADVLELAAQHTLHLMYD